MRPRYLSLISEVTGFREAFSNFYEVFNCLLWDMKGYIFLKKGLTSIRQILYECVNIVLKTDEETEVLKN